ncbi:MAG: glycoside hydrolase family 27 protein [Phycisphaerales bacterium]|nr:glycoside hydrolase family 27 protein [Phycisphaerales bacterium]
MQNRYLSWMILPALLVVAVANATVGAATATGLEAQPGATPFKKAEPALRPYMGWSSWSFLQGDPTQAKVKAQARVLAKRLLAFGYRYVNIDAGWSGGFDKYGRPKPNLKRFPDGMAGLAKWLHARKLKLGVYLIPGISPDLYRANCTISGTHYHIQDITYPTGSGNTLGHGFRKIDYSKPGAMAYIQSCADVLAHWGVDFIKMDFVGPGGGVQGFRHTDNRPDIAHWAKALANTHRPIWYELSNSLSFKYAAFWRKYTNGWRVDYDIETGKDFTKWNNVQQRFYDSAKWAKYAGPGGWNDFDSLEIGNGARDGLSLAERESTMTLWCISCAPLYFGTDLTHLDAADFKIMTNRAAIAIDQAGRPATPFTLATQQMVWRTTNADGTYTVAFFNVGPKAAKANIRWGQLGFKGAAMVRDLWQHKALGNFAHGFSAMLQSHACRLLNVKPLR